MTRDHAEGQSLPQADILSFFSIKIAHLDGGVWGFDSAVLIINIFILIINMLILIITNTSRV